MTAVHLFTVHASLQSRVPIAVAFAGPPTLDELFDALHRQLCLVHLPPVGPNRVRPLLEPVVRRYSRVTDEGRLRVAPGQPGVDWSAEGVVLGAVVLELETPDLEAAPQRVGLLGRIVKKDEDGSATIECTGDQLALLLAFVDKHLPPEVSR